MLGTNHDGVYVIKPKSYDSDKTYPVVFFCHGFLGNWELYNGLLCQLDKSIVVCIGTRDLSGIFSSHDVGKVFTKYVPHLKSEGYHVDESDIHLIGLSNGGTASNIALAYYSNKFKSITFMSTPCNVTKHTKCKVLLIGGGMDSSSLSLPSAYKRLKRHGTPTAIYYEEDENHFIAVHKKDETMNFLNKELFEE